MKIFIRRSKKIRSFFLWAYLFAAVAALTIIRNHTQAIISASLGIAWSAGLFLFNRRNRTSPGTLPYEGQKAGVYKDFFDKSPLPKWVCDRYSLKFYEVNEASSLLYGYSRDEFLTLSVFDLLPADHWQTARDFIDHGDFSKAARANRKHIKKNGDVFDVEIVLNEVSYNGKKELLVSINDISECLRIEEQIKASEKLYRSLFDKSPVLIWVVEVPTLRLLDANQTAIDLFGYTKEEFLSRTAFELLHEEERLKVLERVKQNPENYFGIDRHVKKNGEIMYLEVRVHVTEYNGGNAGLVIGVDVTEKLKAEKVLVQNEIRYRSLIEKSHDGISLHAPDGRLLYATPSVERILGYRPNEIVGAGPRLFVHPDDAKNLNKEILELISRFGETITAQYRMKHKDGRWRWLISNITNMLHEPSVNALVFNYEDVTERKLAKQKLVESEADLRTIFDNANTAFYLLDTNFRIKEFNQLSYNWMLEGNGRMLTRGRLFIDYVREDRKASLQSMFERALNGEVVDIELNGFKQSWYRVSIKRIISSSNQVLGLCISSIDITGQRLFEEKMKNSEELYRFLFTNSPLPAWIAAKDGLQFLEVNTKALDIYGYNQQEFLSMTGFDIRPVEDHQDLTDFLGFEPKKQSEIYSRRHLTKNGEVLFVETVACSLRYKGMDAFLVVVNDITERLRLQDQLVRAKVNKQKEKTRAMINGQERERNALGRELHDNVNQMLATVKLYLDSASSDEKDRVRLIGAAHGLTNKCIGEIRKISKALVPPSLGDLSLHEAMKELIQPIYLTETQISVTTNGLDEAKISEDLKISIFRILQEQLNNIMKYADASAIAIRLDQTPEMVDLEIMDNGKGFDVTKKRYGIGITNMMNRASIFNGKLVINSSPGKGCKLKVHFQLMSVMKENFISFSDTKQY